MAIIRDKNRGLSKRKKTTVPEEVFETEAKIRNKEMLKLLGISKKEPVILTNASIYKGKERCYKSNYRERKLYNNKNKLIAKYKYKPENFIAVVGGYLKVLLLRIIRK